MPDVRRRRHCQELVGRTGDVCELQGRGIAPHLLALQQHGPRLALVGLEDGLSGMQGEVIVASERLPGVRRLLTLMCVAQLSTGPVLTLLYRSCRGRAGLAFGVNCLALFASTLFLHCPERVLFYFAGDFLAVALEFAATAWVRLPRWFMALVTVNLCTHPALTYAVSRLGRTPTVIIVGETLVVLVETGLLKLLYRRQAVSTGRFFLIALWMNAASYIVGACLFGT